MHNNENLGSNPKKLVGEWIVGEWRVNFDSGFLYSEKLSNGKPVYPESRTLSVLHLLMAERGKLVTTDRILQSVWANRVVTRDSVSTAIYRLRQLLGDDSGAPTYIRTESRLGYCLVAPVSEGNVGRFHENTFLRRNLLVVAVAAIAIAFLAIFYPRDSDHQLSISSTDDISGDPGLANLSVAIDATLTSALVRLNPDSVVTSPDNAAARWHMESVVVACDAGPALVVNLLDQRRDRIVWSKAYLLSETDASPNLVELVAREVTYALRKK